VSINFLNTRVCSIGFSVNVSTLLLINPHYEWDVYDQIRLRILRIGNSLYHLKWITFVLLKTNDENALMNCINKNYYFLTRLNNNVYKKFEIKQFESLVRDKNIGTQIKIDEIIVNSVLYKNIK
jgi:hypothetical protein